MTDQDPSNDPQYDSDGGEFEPPKDEYLFFYKAYKLEEKKYIQHQRFEDMACKYWQLLRRDPDCNISSSSISLLLYTKLMKRVYKALLPIYREEEMDSEIAQEWLMDSRGQQEGLNFSLFTKLLFRIAHQWATHIDMDEYMELLDKIYERISFSQASEYFQSKQYTVTFPLEEQKIVDAGSGDNAGAKMDDWLECRSDESNKSDYDYKYEEDQVNMLVKKYKKMKNDYGNLGPNAAQGVTIKEPYVYKEDIVIVKYPSEYEYAYPDVDILMDLDYVKPFGYYTEQFFAQVKNDVYQVLQTAKEQNKQEIARLKRQMRETNKEIDLTQYAVEIDSGLVDPEQPLTMFGASLSGSLYNQIRKSMREATGLSLRMMMQFPNVAAKPKSRSQLNANDPWTEINKIGYNPALERRLIYKLMPTQADQTVLQWYNIHYLVLDPYLHALFRSDVQKIETKGKLAIKESEEVKRLEDFVNVDTSYKKTRQIMLSKKFETIYQDRTSVDNKEQKRLTKIVEKEEKRLKDVMSTSNIQKAGLRETYELNSFVKMMRGPFNKLESASGISSDYFYGMPSNDLYNAARSDNYRIFVMGKPRSGKTTIAKSISKQLDLVHINIENWISSVFEKKKAKEAEQAEMGEPEEGQVLPPILNDLELQVVTLIKQGQGPNDEIIVQIIQAMVNSPEAKTKGFILDLPYYQREQPWAQTITYQGLLGYDYNGNTQTFSHIVELDMDDDDIILRTQGIRVDPKDGVVYSKWEREERKKPKPELPEGEDPPEEDDENTIKPLDETTLVQRINDQDDKVREELNYYNTIERPAMEDILLNVLDNQYIQIDAAGLTPDEILNAISCKIRPDSDIPLRPKAFQIENGSDFKSLLTEGLEENQLPRIWNHYKLVDPVALFNQKLVQGTSEFAAHYNNSVFVFSTEDNMKAFLLEPKKYIQFYPSMPAPYRVMMLGPKGVGKHTQAQKLNQRYGWQVVDFKDLVRSKIDEMSRQETHIPNNPVGGRIGLSEQELQDIIEGKSFPAWKFIPWIFDYLNAPLEKKRPPPPEEKGDDEPPEEDIPEEDIKKKKDAEAKKKKEEEEKKRKEEEEIQRQKEERRKRRQDAIDQGLDLAELGLENEEEEIIIIEDLPIDQIALKIDDSTGKPTFVGGFILIGFPETEEQLNKLKEYGLEFDKVIYLGDTNEEDPGAEVKKRMKDVELYDYDFENEFAQKILALTKDQLGEDIVKEISCNGTDDTVFIRIQTEIDPFYTKADNMDDVRVTADLGEDDKKLPKGNFGDYCPVTYAQDNWLVRGDVEQEVVVDGRTYWPAGPKEAEIFKFNPVFIINQFSSIPLSIPPPKILVLGQKGSGVSTQIRMLCDKYKLEEFNLKEEFLKALKEEKDKRKRRRLLDRGFKPPLPPEEEGMESPPDPEIEDDPEDFDREAHEREVLKKIFDSSKGLVIDGTWTDLPEDSVSQPLQELLFQARRMPEIVIMFKCKEKSTFDRMIDYESIKREYDGLMLKRDTDRQKAREEDRVRKLEELMAEPEGDPEEGGKTMEEKEEEMRKWDEDRDAEDEAADENDPEKPNLDEMTEKFREALRERREKDEAFIEEFGTAMKDKQVQVVDDIKTDISAEYVFLKLLDRIKDNFNCRNDTIEQQQAQMLKPEEVPFYEKSYTYKQSKYGNKSPLSLSNPIKTKKFAVLYRERIYFLSDEQQQKTFLKEPTKYQAADSIPLDVSILPKVFVHGYPKIGKSTICQALAQKTGMVHLHMSKVILSFMERDSLQGDELRGLLQSGGQQLEDEKLVNILMKRLQLQDVQTKGFVLEDFPKTRNQALLLAKKGLVPTNVIYLRHIVQESFNRNSQRDVAKFGRLQDVFDARLLVTNNNVFNMLTFYQRFYNNVSEIDASKSKWFVEDRAFKEITDNLAARQEFAKTYSSSYLCTKMRTLHMDRCLVKQSLSPYKYFCPVTWKNEKALAHCVENTEDCVLYYNFFYYFKNTKERDIFIANPSKFTNSVNLPNDLPLRLLPHKAAEITSYEKALGGHCATTLVDEERVVKGDPILVVSYKGGKYAFESEYKLQKFFSNPLKYSKAQLPVKMPPTEDKVNLYNLSKMEDSISFMEQALGQIVTRALREVSENRLKYPGISVKETMLKLFALFLKTNNPANTDHMRRKYLQKMKQFIQRCELPEEIYDLAMEKDKKKNSWVEHKEVSYNKLGDEYDKVATVVVQEKLENFMNYVR